MNTSEAYDLVSKFQKWRIGCDDDFKYTSSELTQAIDILLKNNYDKSIDLSDYFFIIKYKDSYVFKINSLIEVESTVNNIKKALRFDSYKNATRTVFLLSKIEPDVNVQLIKIKINYEIENIS